jgi:hypothetical protein
MGKSDSRQDKNNPAHSAPSVPGGAPEASSAGKSLPAAKRSQRWLAMPQVWALAAMLLLAMMGMGIASAYQERGWLAWSFIVIIYGGISLWLDSKRAKSAGQPFWPRASRHIAHWLGIFIALKILFVVEQLEFISTVVVGDVALLLMGLTCYFAGVYLNGLFFVVALFLGVMAYVDAYFTEHLWLIMTFMAFVSIAAVGLVHARSASKG